jgi:predicted metalloprotease with PDZ domain
MNRRVLLQSAAATARRTAGVLACLVSGFAAGLAAQATEPIVYVVRVEDPASHFAEIEARVPTDGKTTIELMMPTWTPGFYRVEDYAAEVRDLTARSLDGQPLAITRPSRKNRWTVTADGAAEIRLRYRLHAEKNSVTTNWIGPQLLVLNGAASFITLAETRERPHEVTLVPPAAWKRASTALARAPGEASNSWHWRAADFDELVDSPIVAGDLDIHSFTIDGHSFDLVDAGRPSQWDGARAARDLAHVVRANQAVWGDLPFERYVFLNVFRRGGGGLEHRSSTLLTANAERALTGTGYCRWLSFVAHEFVHAYNVKRLRPRELGPFDYEREPRTPSLWIAEGLTTYLADLALARARLITREEYLATVSSSIAELQREPGRLEQTLEQSSLDVWSNSLSGINPSVATVSYYEKGAVVGFLLDARIRRATLGARSLDDLMRAAYRRYGGAHGFTPEEFRSLASEIAGSSLEEWFHRAEASTEELDYSEALAWFGLTWASPDPAAEARWELAVSPDATAQQRAHFEALLAGR